MQNQLLNGRESFHDRSQVKLINYFVNQLGISEENASILVYTHDCYSLSEVYQLLLRDSICSSKMRTSSPAISTSSQGIFALFVKALNPSIKLSMRKRSDMPDLGGNSESTSATLISLNFTLLKRRLQQKPVRSAIWTSALAIWSILMGLFIAFVSSA